MNTAIRYKCGGPGGKPGPCAGPDQGEASPEASATATPTDSSPAPAEHPQAGSAARRLARGISRLPAKVWAKAKKQVASSYSKLESRYGPTYAKAVLAAGIAGTLSTPLPGGGIVAAAPLIAAGELYLRLGRKPKEAPKKEPSALDFTATQYDKARLPVTRKHIVKLGPDKYRLYSKEGKNLGTFGSHAAAAKHEGQVEYFKGHGKSRTSRKGTACKNCGPACSCRGCRLEHGDTQKCRVGTPKPGPCPEGDDNGGSQGSSSAGKKSPSGNGRKVVKVKVNGKPSTVMVDAKGKILSAGSLAKHLAGKNLHELVDAGHVSLEGNAAPKAVARPAEKPAGKPAEKPPEVKPAEKPTEKPAAKEPPPAKPAPAKPAPAKPAERPAPPRSAAPSGPNLADLPHAEALKRLQGMAVSPHDLTPAKEAATEDYHRELRSMPLPEGLKEDTAAAVSSMTGSFSRPNIHQVYDRLKEKHPALTVQQLHAVILRGIESGQLRATAYTQAISTLKDPQFVLPLNLDKKYYLEPGPRAGEAEGKQASAGRLTRKSGLPRVPATPRIILPSPAEQRILLTYKAGRDGNTGLVHEGDVVTDDDAMSAACILASSNRDRQGDIIECSGVDFRDHIQNPISLWDHGKRMEEPIGKTEDAEGQYHVHYHEDSDIITEKTFFAPTPFAKQIYSLIRGRFVRANSIAVKDLLVEELEPDPEHGHPPRRDANGRRVPYKWIKKSILAEVTWTPLPANPDAVASLLGRGRINTGGANDDQLDPIIRKSFEPFLPPARVWSGGVTLKSLSAQLASEPPRQRWQAVIDAVRASTQR